jgi:hypothetical protein
VATFDSHSSASDFLRAIAPTYTSQSKESPANSDLCYNPSVMANDHYVPQFYLRNFSPPGEKGQIYVYRRTLPPTLEGISSVASDENYYKKHVDKRLKKQEKVSAPIIKKLLTAPKIELTSDERRRLSVFVAFLANRTPFSQERLHKKHSAILESFVEYCSDKDEFFRYERAKGYAGTDDELEQIRQRGMEAEKHSQIEYQPAKTDDRLMEVALELSQDSTPLIQNKQWHILESTVFVTSDNPVILPRIETQLLLSALGFGRGSVLLPLSPTRCLLMDDAGYGNGVLNVKREKAIEINEYIIASAHDAVFANVESQDIEKAFNRTVPGENTNVRALSS